MTIARWSWALFRLPVHARSTDAPHTACCDAASFSVGWWLLLPPVSCPWATCADHFQRLLHAGHVAASEAQWRCCLLLLLLLQVMRILVFKEFWYGLPTTQPLQLLPAHGLDKPIVDGPRPTPSQLEGSWKVFSVSAVPIEEENPDTGLLPPLSGSCWRHAGYGGGCPGVCGVSPTAQPSLRPGSMRACRASRGGKECRVPFQVPGSYAITVPV
jgi:hypothetical protein